MEWLDVMIEVFDIYYDTLALFIVCYLAWRLKSLVAFVVLADFALTYIGQNWIKSLELWGSLGLDYHYALGIKDTIMALALLFLAANIWLTAAYALPALLCWGLWFGYWIYDEALIITVPLINFDINLGIWLTEQQWEQLYYAWSPAYALAMILQIIALKRGGGDAGKRVRRAALSTYRYRLLQSINSLAYARITQNYRRATESDR